MKRRNVESNKYRKQFHFKKCKFAEGIYGSSSFIYLKFLIIWLLIMIADYVLEFRFEFLWPFWLVIRSLHDSFKYQGIIFSLFFALIAFLSDLLCYMFLPVQWLFFAASTYVWVQYVWHTEKGICLPTISLWLLFVYIEASFRLKNIDKTIDLCRPFAAHCIGYPMVTLGFGFKSYLGYKFRLKKQKEIQKSNDFYLQLIEKALPVELQQAKKKDKFKAALNYEEEISSSSSSSTEPTQTNSTSTNSNLIGQICNTSDSKFNKENKQSNSNNSCKSSTSLIASALSFYLNSNSNNNASNSEDLPYIQQKDIANTVVNKSNFSKTNNKNSSSYVNENGELVNSILSSSNKQSYNKSSFFNGNFSQNSNSNFNSSKSKPNENGNTLNCNLSSISISSLAYGNSSTNNDHQNGNVGLNVNSSNGNLLLLSSSKSNDHHNHHHQRSASSSSNSTTTTTTTILPNNTNININMTINTTAIAAAAATATATNGQNVPGSNTSNSANSSSSSGSSKKNKNKENRANSVNSSSNQSASSLSSAALALSSSNQSKQQTQKQQLQQQQQNGTNGQKSSLNEDIEYKDELIIKLEEDLKKSKMEIEQQKTVEQYLRNQINYITKCDKAEKSKLEKLQQENESLLLKYNKLNSQKQKEKEDYATLDKRYQEEKRTRFNLETQLSQEKKYRETQERLQKHPSSTPSPPPQSVSPPSSLINSTSQPSNGTTSNSKQNGLNDITNGNGDLCCTELCKKKLKDYENENKMLSEECRKKQERIVMLDCELKTLAKYREAETRVDTLKVAFKLMEDKNASLQESLSAETRFKLDLFSALGETRRQLEFVSAQLEAKERELNEFKSILKQSIVLTNGSGNSGNNSAADLNDQNNQNELISQYLANQLNSLQSMNNSSSASPAIASSSSSNSISNSTQANTNNNTNGMLMNGSVSRTSSSNGLSSSLNGKSSNVSLNSLINGTTNSSSKSCDQTSTFINGIDASNLANGGVNYLPKI